VHFWSLGQIHLFLSLLELLWLWHDLRSIDPRKDMAEAPAFDLILILCSTATHVGGRGLFSGNPRSSGDELTLLQ